MTKITALVSAYYAADFIQDRIKNLQAQTQPPFIVVVCKSGSKEQHTALDMGVACFVTSDIPPLYKAWNFGIRHIETDYITSANSDDLFYPDGLEAMEKYLDEHPEIDVVHGDCHVKDKGKVMGWIRPGESISISACRVGPMPMWRRSLHERFGMFDEGYKVAGDYEFWLRCLKMGARFAHLNRVVGIYWKRHDSLEHREEKLLIMERNRLREKWK